MNSHNDRLDRFIHLHIECIAIKARWRRWWNDVQTTYYQSSIKTWLVTDKIRECLVVFMVGTGFSMCCALIDCIDCMRCAFSRDSRKHFSPCKRIYDYWPKLLNIEGTPNALSSTEEQNERLISGMCRCCACKAFCFICVGFLLVVNTLNMQRTH